MIKLGCVGWKIRKSSINTMSHDSPMVSELFVYRSTTTHDGSATIHHGGATNAQDASTIRYGVSTNQAESTMVASRRFSGCHVIVCQIMTPNNIISSTFDKVSHAIKKKSCNIACATTTFICAALLSSSSCILAI